MPMAWQYQIELPDVVTTARNGTPNVPASSAVKRLHYSGRVVDEQGNGIGGVEIEMSYDRNHMIYTAGDVLTDADGRFSRLMPMADLINLRFRLTHPDFLGYQFAESIITPPADDLLSGKAVLVMKRGLTLSGVVRDAAGQPIENALVLTASSYSTTGGDQEPIEDFTSPRTDKGGRFVATGLPAGPREILVSAEGFAPKIVSANVSPDAKPIETTLDTGTTYSARIVDEQGQPIAKAHVSCEGWECGERRPLVRLATADVDGRFMLMNLPGTGTLRFYAGGGQRGERAGVMFDWSELGKKLDTITLYPYPVIEGKVVDAETGAAVRKFKVATGLLNERGFEALDFSYSKTVNPGDGTFSKRIDGFTTTPEDSGKYALRIIADGYAPTLTPPVRLGEKHGPFVVQMQRAQPVAGVVRDAGGKTIEGADVMLADPRNDVRILDGRLNDQPSNVPDVRMKTKRDGRFSLSGGNGAARLIVLHEQGYALIDPARMKPGDVVVLIPWSRIEGVALAGGKSASVPRWRRSSLRRGNCQRVSISTLTCVQRWTPMADTPLPTCRHFR